jgi:nucleoside-diphosphate-sugar epimerase
VTLFVTGAESFIGRALAGYCRSLGVDIVGVDTAPGSGANTLQADIRDAAIGDLMPQNAIIVHLAAISRDPDCRADPKAAFDVNVTGTLNLAAAAQRRAVRQFIFASSEWVYGEVANDEVQREDQTINITAMKSEYAMTKIVAEQCLRISFQLPAVTILRFGIVYGPRAANWSAVESLFNAVRTQDEVKVGSIATARRFIHVNDIVSGILASRGRTGTETFNLSGDAPISLGAVIDTSAKLLGRRPRVIEANASHVSIRNPDNTKARLQLGWKPAIDLNTGLKTLADFMADGG